MLQPTLLNYGTISVASVAMRCAEELKCALCALQVAVGLRSQGFVRRVEAWWGPSANTQPWQKTEDGPLIALRVKFTGDKEPEVSCPLVTDHAHRMHMVAAAPWQRLLRRAAAALPYDSALHH
jgi:hypothetical protein